MSLTPAQSLALKALQKEYVQGDEFSTTLESVSGRQISKATLRALADKAYLKYIRTDDYSYSVRGRFGRSIRYTKSDITAVYTFA